MTPKQKARKWLLNEILSIAVGIVMFALLIAAIGIWVHTAAWMHRNNGQAAAFATIFSPMIPIIIIVTYIRYRDKIKEFNK